MRVLTTAVVAAAAAAAAGSIQFVRGQITYLQVPPPQEQLAQHQRQHGLVVWQPLGVHKTRIYAAALHHLWQRMSGLTAAKAAAAAAGNVQFVRCRISYPQVFPPQNNVLSMSVSTAWGYGNPWASPRHAYTLLLCITCCSGRSNSNSSSSKQTRQCDQE
jgi:predicted lysophospholipase L1 biosynthesis ABC-type transport system permease subunit